MRNDNPADNAPSLGYDALPASAPTTNEAERVRRAFKEIASPPFPQLLSQGLSSAEEIRRREAEIVRRIEANDPIDWRKSTALGFAILIVTAAALAAFAFLLFEAGRQAEREKIKAAAVEGLRR